MTRAIISGVALLLTHLAFATEQSQADSFWLGILRDDGVLTPIAIYDNGMWSTPWPEDLGAGGEINEAAKRLALPPFRIQKNYRLEPQSAPLEQLPREWLGRNSRVPVDWYLSTQAGTLEPIRVASAIQYGSHCTYNWGLLADAKKADPGNEWPRKKAGFAVSENLRIAPMNAVDAGASETQEILGVAKRQFTSLETKDIEEIARRGGAVDGYLRYSGHPLRKRETTDVSVTHMVKGSLGPNGWLYYIEMQRSYGEPNTGCGAITAYNGWFRKDAGTLTPITTRIVITNCDMKETDRIKPDLILSIGGNTYVISENYGYESEAYSVDLLTGSELRNVVRRNGGGC